MYSALLNLKSWSSTTTTATSSTTAPTTSPTGSPTSASTSTTISPYSSGYTSPSSSGYTSPSSSDYTSPSGSTSPTQESDRHSKRSDRDLREVLSRAGALLGSVRESGDLRERLELVRGAIGDHEQELEGRESKDSCDMHDSISTQPHKSLSMYSDEKSTVDSKGKENSKDDVIQEGKEKPLTSEWGQRKKKKKKRSKSRSRSKERKPLADKEEKDSENRKRKHDDKEERDVSKAKKEKHRSASRDKEDKKKKRDRSTSRDQDDKKKKKEKKKDKKRSKSREIKKRSKSEDHRSKSQEKSSTSQEKELKSESRKYRIDSGISTLTNFSKDSVSPRETSPVKKEASPAKKEEKSPKKKDRSPKRGRSRGRSSPRRVESKRGRTSPRRADSPRRGRSGSRSERRGRSSPRKPKDAIPARGDVSVSPRKNKHTSPKRSSKKERRSIKKNGLGSPSLSPSPSPPRRIVTRAESVEKPTLSFKPKDRGPQIKVPEEILRVLNEAQEREDSQKREEEATKAKEISVNGVMEEDEEKNDVFDKEEKMPEDQNDEHENQKEEKSSENQEESIVSLSSQEKEVTDPEKERKGSKERRSSDKGRKSSDKTRRSSRSRERNPYSVYDEKHGHRGERRRRSRSRHRGDLKDEVERLKRDRRRSRSRSPGRRGSRRVSDDMYRRARDGRYPPRVRRYSGDLRRSLDRVDSWEDKVESFLHATTSHSSSLKQLLPQDFDPTKPPPMPLATAVVPPDYALTEYQDPTAEVPDVAAPPIRQLTDVTTGEIIPQPGIQVAGQLQTQVQAPVQEVGNYYYPTATPAHQNYPAMAQTDLSLPPPNYVQTEVTTYSVPPQVNGNSQTYNEAAELAAMNQLNDENAKARKEAEKPLTVKEKKKAEKAGKELWQFVAKKLLSDPVFCQKAKKKKAKSLDELKEKAEKCAVRIAMALEKGGYSEIRLWKIVKDNEKGIQGFSAELSSAVMNGDIEADVEARSPKHRLDAELLRDGAVFRYIGQYIQGNPCGGRMSVTPTKVSLASS